VETGLKNLMNKEMKGSKIIDLMIELNVDGDKIA
jgi:hypothetical protein